jgi:hypothetical protein
MYIKTTTAITINVMIKNIAAILTGLGLYGSEDGTVSGITSSLMPFTGG